MLILGVLPFAGNCYPRLRNINEVGNICLGGDGTSMKVVLNPPAVVYPSTLFAVSFLFVVRCRHATSLFISFRCSASSALRALQRTRTINRSRQTFFLFFEKKVRPLLAEHCFNVIALMRNALKQTSCLTAERLTYGVVIRSSYRSRGRKQQPAHRSSSLRFI